MHPQVLAIVTFGTAFPAMGVILSAGQWRIFVASQYRAYGVLAMASGTWAYLTWLCEMWLAIGHRFAQQLKLERTTIGCRSRW